MRNTVFDNNASVLGGIHIFCSVNTGWLYRVTGFGGVNHSFSWKSWQQHPNLKLMTDRFLRHSLIFSNLSPFEQIISEIILEVIDVCFWFGRLSCRGRGAISLAFAQQIKHDGKRVGIRTEWTLTDGPGRGSFMKFWRPLIKFNNGHSFGNEAKITPC